VLLVNISNYGFSFLRRDNTTVRQKGVTDLLQHTIDMANDWDSAKQKFTQFDKSPADIISHTKPGDKEDQNKCQ